MKLHRRKTYWDKLQDVRWQRRRMEIWKIYGGFCQYPGCENPNMQIDVHHKVYLRNTEPWDYPIWCFTLYCRTHHEIEQDRMERAHLGIASNPILIQSCIDGRIENPVIVARNYEPPKPTPPKPKFDKELGRKLFDEMRKAIA